MTLAPSKDADAALRVTLPSGVLDVRVERAESRVRDLIDFGVRENPRRGFLFVSRVLGKHLAVRPHVVWRTHRSLARQLDADLPGPVVFVGLAETATLLGQGVFTAFARRTLRSDLVYLSTTRYRLAEREALSFEEVHSHAPTHHLHLPDSDLLRAMLREARTLVLVDDELSTGKTLGEVASALRGVAPDLERVCLVSLTDFLGERRAAVLSQFGLPTTSAALLHGDFDFAPDEAWQPDLPRVTSGGAHLAPARGGRVGVGAFDFARTQDAVERLADDLEVLPGDCVRVLGSGEFQFEPFRLALELERRGADVLFHASTRSPIHPFGPVVSRHTFSDSYGDGIANFLYNLPEDGPDRTLMLFETPPSDAADLTPPGLAVERLWWPRGS